MEGRDSHGLSEPKTLEKIDRLFACNVGEYVNLPQIVVVGDQSSGKSSVLEGLIKMPFPRDSGLCTRFATQITFRRSPTAGVQVSIIPDSSATSEHREKVRNWRKQVGVLDAPSFLTIMSEVHEVMGLASKTDRHFNAGSIFSTDVLRLEISGPDEDHLTVIDVPGIFKNTSGGSTTKADMLLVQSMVRKYMENPRSAMLTVIPSNVDIATQEILEIAAEVDPEGRRTLGVLTKPDLVDHGAEPAVVDLVEGRAHIMQLGWHLVRNPGQNQLADVATDRDALETTFFRDTLPWKSLDKEKVGTGALRRRLQEVLSDLVRHEFPKVRKEVIRMLASAQTQLKNLGMKRESTENQSTYLTQMAANFQRLVSLSIEAKYGKDEFFNADISLRLATAIMARNVSYADGMRMYGERYPFVTRARGGSNADDTIPPALDWSQSETGTDDGNEWEVRTEVDAPGLEDILQPPETVHVSVAGATASWLRGVYETSRGFELGTFDSSILATTMKAQTTNWILITMGYVSDIISLVHRFIMAGLDAVCHDKRVKAELSASLTEGLVDRYEKAIAQAQFLLSVERSGTPITLNHYFNDNLEKCRLKRIQTGMESISFTPPGHGPVVRVEDLGRTHLMSNTEHVVQEVHDILYSYYQVACKRMVDNVCMQVVDHLLVNGLETPLSLFSPVFVSGLTAERLEAIAGEDQMTKRSRKQLVQDIQNLKDAKKIVT